MSEPSDLPRDTIPAATLVVMRDGEGRDPPAILMVTRAARMAFAAGAVVFPGGRVDPADMLVARRDGREGDGARVTAIRETLEESGIAVAMGEVAPDRALGWQEELLAGLPFADLLVRERIALRYEGLVPFTRWIPGIPQPRRFDTIFFLARAGSPAGSPRPQPGECLSATWISAAAQLDAIARGEAHAIFPTKRNLERLALFADHGEALDDIARHGVATIVPRVEERGGKRFVTIPDGLGYPLTSEPLDTAFRS